jgi:hypothetical protein
MRNLLLSFVCLLSLFSCQQKEEKREIVRPNKDYYNWTGTYEFTDGANKHLLKLHRRDVDLSYEMSYVTSENPFTNSIWSLKDFNDSVQVIFINNFTEDPASIPFTRGDILFSLALQKDSSILTNWQKVKPTNAGTFVKVSDKYN